MRRRKTPGRCIRFRVRVGCGRQEYTPIVEQRHFVLVERRERIEQLPDWLPRSEVENFVFPGAALEPAGHEQIARARAGNKDGLVLVAPRDHVRKDSPGVRDGIVGSTVCNAVEPSIPPATITVPSGKRVALCRSCLKLGAEVFDHEFVTGS